MKKSVVADLPANSIVRFNGEWGVLTRDQINMPRGRRRRLDRWHGPPLELKSSDVVEVLTRGKE